jgi:hypothetical protein
MLHAEAEMKVAAAVAELLAFDEATVPLPKALRIAASGFGSGQFDGCSSSKNAGMEKVSAGDNTRNSPDRQDGSVADNAKRQAIKPFLERCAWNVM